MAHKTKIGGTNYGISGGKTLVGGTGYDIPGGKTKVSGTNYSVIVEPQTSISIGGTPTGSYTTAYGVLSWACTTNGNTMTTGTITVPKNSTVTVTIKCTQAIGYAQVNSLCIKYNTVTVATCSTVGTAVSYSFTATKDSITITAPEAPNSYELRITQ